MTASSATPDLALFVHALASEFDEQAGPAARDVLLRAVGRRMAQRLAPPPCETLQALEIELNDILASIGWGRARLEVLAEEQALRIIHDGLPRIGAVGTPPGHWLEATLEGLYEGWISRQPGAVDEYVGLRDVSQDQAVSGRVIIKLRGSARGQG